MIRKIRNLFVSFFNSHTENIISSSVFDRRKILMQFYALQSKDKGTSNDVVFEGAQLIVSLTTYGKRLYEVYLTIESLMHQTVRPNKIILWLEEGLESDVPRLLQLQEERGLEICFCKDIKSYKKLIPTLEKYPNDFIITVDDDVIYECDMIENLIHSYKKAPGYVYANRLKRIKFQSDFRLSPYNQWELVTSPMDDSILNIPTGVGGVLYPPHCFHQEVFNQSVFMDICPRGDDIWFKSMCILNGMDSRLALVHNPVYYENDSVQDTALYNTNVGNSDNDKQISAVFEKYNLFSKLIKK